MLVLLKSGLPRSLATIEAGVTPSRLPGPDAVLHSSEIQAPGSLRSQHLAVDRCCFSRLAYRPPPPCLDNFTLAAASRIDYTEGIKNISFLTRSYSSRSEPTGLFRQGICV